MDDFTLDITESGLVAAADEMFAVLKRTAMSPIIYEILDVGTGITDAQGNLVSSGAGIPTFVGVLDKAVKAILLRNPALKEGDIYVTNDPYFGGVTHLSDVVLCQPIFHQQELIAWGASIAHWSDIGGRTPGSMSVHAKDIFQEGLRMPAVKLVDQGEIIPGLIDIITTNSRMPDFAKGDLWAQIAAGRRASQRIKTIAAKYGVRTFRAAIERAFDMAEARVRDGLTKIPEGRYSIEGPQDDGNIWKVSIEVANGQFIVDLRDGPMQSDGPFNTSRDGSIIAAQMVLKTTCDPSLAANEGSYRALKVLTREGTQFHAQEPAAQGYYFETRVALFDLLWKCLAQAMPENLPAGHFASICGTVVAGVNPYTGNAFTMVEPQQGGWGATPNGDGISAMYSANHGETYNCPIEICEARYGLTVEEKTLGTAPEQSPNYQGGRGVKTVYKMSAESVISTGFTHAKVPVWAIKDGREGGKNAATIQRVNGETSDIPVASDVKLTRGDLLVIETAAGGGR